MRPFVQLLESLLAQLLPVLVARNTLLERQTLALERLAQAMEERAKLDPQYWVQPEVVYGTAAEGAEGDAEVGAAAEAEVESPQERAEWQATLQEFQARVWAERGEWLDGDALVEEWERLYQEAEARLEGRGGRGNALTAPAPAPVPAEEVRH